MPTNPDAIWPARQWYAEVGAWVDKVLADAGIGRTGPLAAGRQRMWSTHLTVATDQGTVWFKENNPAQRFEAALVSGLAAIAPDQVVPPVAVDPDRGWLLTCDQGPTLGERSGPEIDVWARVVSEYADLQRRTAAHAELPGAVGLPVQPPWEVPTRLRAQVEALLALADDDPRRPDRPVADLVLASLPGLERDAGLLRDAAIPLCLQHNDLHRHNAFVPDTGRLRFFDFGDALWSHPFESMLVAVRMMLHEWDTSARDPRVGRVVDAYLEVWDDLADRSELRTLLRRALRFGVVGRFESWRRLLECADRPAQEEWGPHLAAWLAMVPDPPQW